MGGGNPFDINTYTDWTDDTPLAGLAEQGTNAFNDIVDIVEAGWSYTWDNVLNPVLEPIAGALGFTDEAVTEGFVSVNYFYEGETDIYARNAEAVLRAIKYNDSIPNHLVYNSITSPYHKMIDYFTYGKDTYTYGLPDTSFYTNAYDEEALKAAISSETGGTTVLVNVQIKSPTAEDIGSYNLSKYYGNRYHYPTQTYYNADLTIGGQFNRFEFSEDYSKVNVYILSEGTEYFFAAYDSQYPSNDYYYVVQYSHTELFRQHLWVYNISDQVTHPDLVILSETDNVGVYPLVPIRKNGVTLDSNPNDPNYLSCTALLDKVGLDYQELIDSVVKDAEGNDVPNLSQVQDIYFNYNIKMLSQNTAGIGYLYNFYKYLEATAAVSKEDFESVPAGTVKPKNVYTYKEETFNYALTFSYIKSEIKSGSIGPSGTVTNTAVYVADVDDADGDIIRSYFLLRVQINETTYDEIKVYGPLIATAIKDGTHNTMVVNKITATDTADGMFVPIAAYILDRGPLNFREAVIQEAGSIIVYVADTQYLEWYQTGTFQQLFNFVIRVVAIVLAFPSGGASLSAASALLALFQIALYQYAFEKILVRLLELYGGDEAGALLVVAATVALALYTGNQFDLFDGTSLINITNSVNQGINTYTGYELDILAKEAEEFENLMETREEELEAARAFLSEDGKFNHLFIRNHRTVMNEESDVFLARTTMANPGSLIFDEIHNYVDNQLSLKL